MKSRTLACITAIALLGLLAIPILLAAQDQEEKKEQNAQHHHYKLIDMGTFGGPSSYFNSLFLTDAFLFPTVFYNIAQVRNRRGTFVGFADTSTPDPYPAFCYVPDCFVTHAFEWKDGAKKDLGSLPGGASSAAFWINARGWIAGDSENGETDPLLPGLPELRAVVWKHGKINELGTLGGNQSFAQAINNRGQITGLATNGISDPFSYYYVFLHGFSNGTQTRGFLWDDGEGIQDIGTLGGPDAFPSLINQRGQVAGFSYTSSIPDPIVGLPPFHPFLWEKEKGMKDLGSFGGVQTASVNGLNERGEVVGGTFLPGDMQIHPFLWDGEKLVDLTAPPFGGPGNGEADWINEAGEVVGIAGLSASCAALGPQQHAFLWRKGVMTDLGTIPGTSISRADFINSKTQIVGAAFPCGFTSVTAFLWENGSIVDLNTLIPANSPLYIVWAPFIDDQGVIGAFGALTNGDLHAVLLIPCDQHHSGVEGCDDNEAEATTETPVQSAQIAQAPAATSAGKLSAIEMMKRYRFSMANRNRRFAAFR
jgi:probable HAF family extracellular repeat protein